MEPAGRAIKRFVIWYKESDAFLVKLRFFDKDNSVLLEALGADFDRKIQKEWVLQDE
jgi:hypothetical protein